MSTAKELATKFKIGNITTLQFAVINGEMQDVALNFSAEFKYEISEINQEIGCIFKYQFQSERGTHLIIEVRIDFIVESTSFKKNIIVDDQFVIPIYLAKHLAMICVGTTRGILHEKTNNSPINKFPIPTINVAKRITKDLRIARN